MNGLPPSRLSMDGFAPPPPPPSSSSSSVPRITLFSSRVNSAAKSNGNDNANANGNGNGSSRVETMQRDDTTNSGSESDGDPPGFVGQAPPPPIAPRPVLPKRESSSGGGSNSSSGGVGPPVTKQQQPATTTRSFEELEDITFSSPRSFLAMALQIAQSRGVDLLVDRDNTDTAFRYMHVVCPYRHTGPCPFILKLRAPIEGGWIVTGPPPAGTTQDRATGLNDARGPSTFECKHSPRAMPRDFRPGETVARWLERDTIWARGSAELAEKRDVRRASTPQAHAPGGGLGSGSATKSASGRVLRSSATDGLKQVDSVAGKAPRFPRSAHHVNHSPLNGGGRNGGRDSTASPIASRVSAAAAPASPRSGQSPIQSVPAPSRPAATTTTMDTDRALAPPFQRALDLQAQIAPALGHGAAAGTTTSLSVNGSAPSSSRPKGANPYPPMTFALPPPAPASAPSAAASTVTATAAPASLAANGSVVSGKVPASSTGCGFAPPPPPRPGASTSSSERRPNAAHPTSALPPPALAPPGFPSLRPASWGVSPPCIAKSTSSAIDEWTTFLRDYLGEPELVPLARVLGSAYMSVKPGEFFSPSSRGGGDDEDLRRATLEAIPVEAVGVWPKLRLIKAMRERGQAAWDRWLASKAASPTGDSTMHGD